MTSIGKKGGKIRRIPYLIKDLLKNYSSISLKLSIQMAVCICLHRAYVFHIRVLEVKWSDESHIFTFNAGMYWIHKSPHAFCLVHWSALHQVVCYHAKSTVTDLVVGSRKYIFCLCIPKPASRESQNPGAYPGMILGFIFKLFDVSVWFRTWDYIYSCWYFERERGHCTVRFL